MKFIRLTRRDFFKLMGYTSLLAGLSTVSGCGGGGGGDNSGENNANENGSSVALAKNDDDIYSIKSAIALTGDLDFIGPGDTVLLKIALNSPNDFPATTSPLIVFELIKLLKENGAGKIYVGDRSPEWQDTMNCLERTGIYQATIDAGGEIVVFSETDMRAVNPDKAMFWPNGFAIPDLFQDVDHIITLPTLRTHSEADFTMGLKIFVGALPQQDRYAMHNSPHFFKAIAEIPLCSDKIRLSLLDARQGFRSGGPDSGSKITPGIIVASRNLVAADIVGLALLKTYGTQLPVNSVWDHPTIKRAIEVYSPTLSPDTLELYCENIDNHNELMEQIFP